VLLFLLSVLLAGVLFLPGPRLVEALCRLAQRVHRPRGAEFVNLAGATIRNASRGIIGVAALQALLAGIVFAVAGVPGAGLLALVILVLGILRIGGIPVILPTLIWMWLSFPTGFAILFTALLVPVMVVDNILRPILMAQGLTTAVLVVFIGVIGGAISFGLLGLFLGPVVLAVLYEIVVAWVRGDDPAREAD
jgi:predicted PurR-regulated permease PerM